MTVRRDYALQVQGLTLHVTDWGDPDARPVFMLHGIRGYAETFGAVAEALQPQFRVIAFDQRGRGRSDWDPEWSYYTDTYVADLEGIRAALGLERFDLLGHSMGGITALVYAAAHPTRVNCMVIEDAGPRAFEDSQGAQRIRRELEAEPESFPDLETASVYMRNLRPTVTEAARQNRLLAMLKPLPNGGFTWRHDHAGIAATRLSPDPTRIPDLVSAVRLVQCPTLVLRGGRSDYLQIEMAQDMVRLNPRIQWREIPDAGHYVHDDQPEAFCRVVHEFLCVQRA